MSYFDNETDARAAHLAWADDAARGRRLAARGLGDYASATLQALQGEEGRIWEQFGAYGPDCGSYIAGDGEAALDALDCARAAAQRLERWSWAVEGNGVTPAPRSLAWARALERRLDDAVAIIWPTQVHCAAVMG